MLVGLFQFDLILPQSDSLKAKRLVLKSLKTRLQNKFNVSVAEVDYNEKWQRALLGIAIVSNEKKFIDKTFNQIFNLIDDNDQSEIVDHQVEII
jgi:uncharacterized protein